MRKIIIALITIILIVPISFLSIKDVKADSGWDTSYDSGSSWDSRSSWDSDSSWSNDSSNSSSFDSDYENYIVIILVIIMLLVIIIENRRINKRKPSKKIIITNKNKDIIYNNDVNINDFKNVISKKTYTIKDKNGNIIYNKVITDNNEADFDYEKVIKDKFYNNQYNFIIPNFDEEEFKKMTYKLFCDVQEYWMNFDYDKLKELLTDELYNTYLMDLEALKVKGEQNIMKDFKFVESNLISLKEENGIYTAKLRLEVKFYDYIIDTKTNKVLRGNSKKQIDNTYILTFIKSMKDVKNINECPRCGAPVETNQTGVCEYCKSKLVIKEFDWVLSKKEKISQR